jgi:hypothetical protein
MRPNSVTDQRPRRDAKKVEAVERERSNYEHWLLEKNIVDLCLAQGYEPLTNRHIDLLCNVGDTSVIFEVKASGLSEIAGPVRCAVTQLLEYRYLYRNALKQNIKLCIVSEKRPSSGYEWVNGYLEHLRIGLIWLNYGKHKLNCSEFTKELLGDLFPQMKAWSCGPITSI